MDVQTWASAASIIAVALTAFGVFSRKLNDFRAELKAEIGGVRTELKNDIARLEERTERGFGRVETRLDTLEQRTFELSTRLPPLPTRAE